MNSENFRQCACDPEAVEIPAPIRLLGVIALILALCGPSGCATQMKARSNRPIEAGMEIFVHASTLQHSMDTICIFPFNAPPETASASHWLTTAFQAKLVQRGPFREVRAMPYEVQSDEEALWYARNGGGTLVMRSSLLYMMDGTGGMPTKLVVRTRILDARTGQVLWDIKQSAFSEPGPDVDLTWDTLTGEPAQRCRAIGDCLAQRFAEYLVQPPVKEK